MTRNSVSWKQRLLRGLRLGWFSIALALAFGSIGGMLLFLSGYFHPKVPKHAGSTQRNIAADHPRALVQKLRYPRFETAVGTIKPVHESSLAAKLLARVVEVNVKAGQMVAAGEILVALDDADLKARLNQAEAAVAAAEARKRQADADLARAERLVKSKAIAKSEYDQAVATSKTTASELERARQAQKEGQVVLQYATIRAPFSGTVVDKKVESGDTVSPGQVLLTLYDPARLQMVAPVRESLAARLQVGQKLGARLESLGYQCEATISEIVPEADVSSRSFAVKVTGPCPPGVYSGMFGRLMIPQDEEEILVVPANAVTRVGQLTFVDVVAGDRVSRRAVQLGRTFEDFYEVLSGLQEKETVLTTSMPEGNGNE